MAARILPAAKARLIEIWNYTDSSWGEEQADRYIRELIAAIHRRVGNRNDWNLIRNAPLKGVYFFKHAHHFVFFKELSDGDLGVISILHENMDLPARLRDDLGTE